ncbi:hypothetical protein G6F68_020044 [Rhizopus microsporus]|nr:hypothetical protein G6F68_020044 [Rhizopus microsporus]
MRSLLVDTSTWFFFSPATLALMGALEVLRTTCSLATTSLNSIGPFAFCTYTRSAMVLPDSSSGPFVAWTVTWSSATKDPKTRT